MLHVLKISPKYFNDVALNIKKFELRRNDRPFKVGDRILLREWTLESGFSGNKIERRITYILDVGEVILIYGDAVILGIEPI